MPWQNCEDDPEITTPTDVAIDHDARQWLQLTPADPAAPFTGTSSFLHKVKIQFFTCFTVEFICTDSIQSSPQHYFFCVSPNALQGACTQD